MFDTNYLTNFLTIVYFFKEGKPVTCSGLDLHDIVNAVGPAATR